MIKISNRLKSLTRYINANDHVMDVGCDHALLDIYLVEHGIVPHIFIGDVNENALENGIKNVEKHNLQNNITPILSYGIEKIATLDIDTLILSGMGAKTIIDILNSPNLKRIYKLILQSNNHHYELRKFLVENHFVIVKEEVIKDGKKNYINIICLVTNSPVTYTEKEYLFGPLLIKDKNNLDYFKEELRNLEHISFNAKNDEIEEKIRLLNEIVEELS